ncbi:hypothetical protein P4685_15420, partial [Listeria monocytogenes]|nr:hypothetical protein [Listeria monocytogenes]
SLANTRWPIFESMLAAAKISINDFVADIVPLATEPLLANAPLNVVPLNVGNLRVALQLNLRSFSEVARCVAFDTTCT